MSDERDELISGPPALPGELLRWQDESDGRLIAVQQDGTVQSWYAKGDRGNPPSWHYEDDEDWEVKRRLAAELAACRARDEGDVAAVDYEALRMQHDYWRARIQRRAEARPTRITPGEEQMWDEYNLSKVALVLLLDAAHALLARRATASAATATTTPAGEETTER